MCVATYIRKASGVKHDTESMNRAVQRMVSEALQCNSVVSILDSDVEESIFSPEFIEQLNRVKLPATRLEVLIKMLRKSISQYRNTNKIAAEKFEELLQRTIDEYHNRRAKLSSEEASAAQRDAVDEIIRNATQQALDILNKLGEDKTVSVASALHLKKRRSTIFLCTFATPITLSMAKINVQVRSLSTRNASRWPKGKGTDRYQIIFRRLAYQR